MEEKAAITKKITIFKGDEYRAKIEREFQSDDIFADVYVRAYKIVNEITHEMQQYKEENKKYSARFAGLGNNIVIFCGARGQGKTSAMQSFSECLKVDCNDAKIKGHELLELVKKNDNTMFEVFDPIDPSAMENDESILRVLISRLFYKFEEFIKDKNQKSKKIERLQSIQAHVLELFQQCYDNIDYIKSNKNKNYAQDDFETLSHLGSSAKLKENLYDLVEQYLKLWELDEDCENEVRKKYLVITVDDADLATKKVFQLCEDIRNYLSIPNVIILLAADYEQLVHATYQRYLKQYKMIWKTFSVVNEKPFMADDCYQMAARYLEKIFPSGHRINLPQIDYLMAESYENIKLDYRVKSEREMVSCAAFPEVDNCENIQEQLIQLLYIRTGIILVSQDEAMHVFLPHTFREMTHFVKLLYDMHNITCDEIYRDYERTQDNSDILRERICLLKENILMIKQYFLYSWCISNLSELERRKIQELDDANKSNQMYKVKKKIHEAFETKTEEQSLFHKAVIIYNTILLNEWFAVALEQEKQFDRIAQFVEKPLLLTTDFESKLYKKRYLINQFKVKTSDLIPILKSDIGAADIACLKNFCTAVQEDKPVRSVQFIEWNDEKAQLNDEVDALEFNILQPILVSLTDREMRQDIDYEKSKKNMSTTDEHIDIGELDALDSTDSVEGKMARHPYLITVRNILANTDMQIYLRSQLDLWYKKLNRARDVGTPWFKIVITLYGEIDKLLEQKTYHRAKSEAVCLYEYFNSDSKFMPLLFLCNKENQDNYCAEREEILNQCFQKINGSFKTLDAKYRSGNKNDISDREVKDASDILDDVDTALNSGIIMWSDIEAKGELVLGQSDATKWSRLMKLQKKVYQEREKLINLVASIEKDKSEDKKEN